MYLYKETNRHQREHKNTMSKTTSDFLRNVHSGRADWKVKVRVIREWRGSKDGQLFKGFNLLLLDSKVFSMVYNLLSYVIVFLNVF